jgi:virginiamycin B lyase
VPGDAEPEAIAAGPDRALWFTEYGDNTLGRITVHGVVTAYAQSGGELQHNPFGIAIGPDKALWIARYPDAAIVRAVPYAKRTRR